MTDGAPPAKLCVSCGQNCAGRPRVKDSQGRYMCRPCLLRARAESGRVKPVTIAAEDTDLLATILEMKSGSLSATPCPSCGAGLIGGATVCGNCGHDVRTGKPSPRPDQARRAL